MPALCEGRADRGRKLLLTRCSVTVKLREDEGTERHFPCASPPRRSVLMLPVVRQSLAATGAELAPSSGSSWPSGRAVLAGCLGQLPYELKKSHE